MHPHPLPMHMKLAFNLIGYPTGPAVPSLTLACLAWQTVDISAANVCHRVGTEQSYHVSTILKKTPFSASLSAISLRVFASSPWGLGGRKLGNMTSPCSLAMLFLLFFFSSVRYIPIFRSIDWPDNFRVILHHFVIYSQCFPVFLRLASCHHY
jgi:hypothetical protein